MKGEEVMLPMSRRGSYFILCQCQGNTVKCDLDWLRVVISWDYFSKFQNLPTVCEAWLHQWCSRNELSRQTLGIDQESFSDSLDLHCQPSTTVECKKSLIWSPQRNIEAQPQVSCKWPLCINTDKAVSWDIFIGVNEWRFTTVSALHVSILVDTMHCCDI